MTVYWCINGIINIFKLSWVKRYCHTPCQPSPQITPLHGYKCIHKVNIGNKWIHTVILTSSGNFINLFIYFLTNTCHVIHVVHYVLRSWDDFVFRQHRVHNINNFRTHIVRQLIGGIIVFVEQRNYNKTKRFT